MQGLIAMRKSPWEKNKSKIYQYSITQIKVHWVDQLGSSHPAKLRKNSVDLGMPGQRKFRMLLVHTPRRFPKAYVGL